MTFKFPAATKLMLSLAAVGVLAIGLGVTQADAQTKRKPSQRQRRRCDQWQRHRLWSGRSEPVVSIGTRTRVFVTTRSWLDAGVEVLPGDRKFNDYAFPQSRSFAQENLQPPARSSAAVPVL